LGVRCSIDVRDVQAGALQEPSLKPTRNSLTPSIASGDQTICPLSPTVDLREVGERIAHGETQALPQVSVGGLHVGFHNGFDRR
jgi:hypothetical protein